MKSYPVLGSACCFLALALSGFAADAKQPSSKYLEVVQRSADTLLENARDTYGKQHTGMILSVLDRNTGKPARRLPNGNMPTPPTGIRYADRTGLGGSNANLQIELYRVLDHLSEMTGDPRYTEASKTALVDFVVTTQHPDTGLLAWGEHLYWDCVRDRLGDLDPNKIHEPKRKFIYFDELLEWDSERALKYARGLWEHQIADQKTGDFSRHAKYHVHNPGRGKDFPKEAGYFIDTWSHAYAKTKDIEFQTAVRVMANRYLGRMNEKTRLFDFETSGNPDQVNWSVTLSNLGLAMDSQDAVMRMDNETREILSRLATRIDEGFLALGHQVLDPTKGFVCYAYTDSGKPRPIDQKKSEGYSVAWGMGYGIHTTSMFATHCYTRQGQLGATKQGDAYRKMVVEAAKLYQKAQPDPQADDIWAGEYGLAILTELAAYRLTGDKSYLATAQTLGDAAIGVFWDNNSPLPRASSKSDYYDVISYADTLMYSLLALHEATTSTSAKLEISDLVR